MQQITGKGISPGIAVGKIRYQKKEQKKIISRAVEDAEKECERYHRAISYVDEQLRKLYEQSQSGNGETGAAIYDSYRIILEDEEYVGAVKRRIKEEKVCAEYAIGQIKEKYIQVFSASEDELLKARIADIEDVSERLIIRLLQEEDDTDYSEKQSISAGEARVEKDPVILLAESLSPSEFLDAEKEGLLAVITQHGSELSHTAILARMSETPMITGVTADLSWDGKTVIADGNTGVLTIDPDEESIAEKYRMREEKEAQRKQLRALIGLPSETKSGKRIRICANIGGIEDVDPALNNDAEGIGLFRSEFLYIESDHFPSEEKQFQIYRTATQRMGERKTVIRTLDIGSDKQLDYFDLNTEGRPDDYRGVQICLDHPDIFRTQLRAIFRASAYGKTAILFPMITELEEVQQCKKYAEEVKQELIREGLAIDKDVALGIMIETPEAVRISETLAKEVDFFSIGTNDLTYYAMKDLQQKNISDTRSDVAAEVDISVVLELIRKTVKSAHRAGIPAAICGEMAADTNLTGRFLDYGIDELSVVPAKVLVLRSRVRELD